MIKEVINFYNHPLFIVVGGLTVTLGVLGFIYKIICWFFGITPIVFRLGIALWKRRVAVFASNANYENIQISLVDSKIFKEKNIIRITKNNIDKAKNETIFLVDWESFNKHIEQVFSARKDDQTAIIIYAKPTSIPNNIMSNIANRTNTVVVNFRGRLLNDVLTSLITTSYDSK